VLAPRLAQSADHESDHDARRVPASPGLTNGDEDEEPDHVREAGDDGVLQVHEMPLLSGALYHGGGTKLLLNSDRQMAHADERHLHVCYNEKLIVH
jgi:hypothetical protein